MGFLLDHIVDPTIPLARRSNSFLVQRRRAAVVDPAVGSALRRVKRCTA
jgi:hypothetical protein